MGRNTTERYDKTPPSDPDASPHVEVVSDGIHDGLVWPLEEGRPFRIGRSFAGDLIIPDSADSVSRNHAELRLEDGVVSLIDLDSKNGSLLDRRRVHSQRVRDGSRIQLGVDVKLRVLWLTEEEAARHHAAFLDDLTGCASRRRFDIDLHDARARAIDREAPLALALLDVDHFGAFNKERGFTCGDAVLRAVAERNTEVAAPRQVYRLGGEEFAVLLEGQDQAAAAELAERIRSAIEQLVVPWEDDEISITASLGAAGHVPAAEDDPRALLARADSGLREAKEGGRNQVGQAD